MFIKTDYKPELGAYTIKFSNILLHKMPAQHIVSTLEMITFRRRNMYKTKNTPFGAISDSFLLLYGKKKEAI